MLKPIPLHEGMKIVNWVEINDFRVYSYTIIQSVRIEGDVNGDFVLVLKTDKGEHRLLILDSSDRFGGDYRVNGAEFFLRAAADQDVDLITAEEIWLATYEEVEKCF